MSEQKSCKKCMKTKSYKHFGIIVLGLYVLFSCIYGTVEIVKELISIMK
jgi:hypothetical protein